MAQIQLKMIPVFYKNSHYKSILVSLRIILFEKLNIHLL